MSVRNKIKSLPGFKTVNLVRLSLKERFSMLSSYFYDYKKFNNNYSFNATKTDKEGLSYWILQDKHRLEKGLSLPSPRLGFGELVITRLCNNLQSYKEKYGKDDVYYFGVGALRSYKDFHEEKEPQFLSKCLTADLLADSYEGRSVDAGITPVKKFAVHDSFSDLAINRHSCRHFDINRVVEAQTIKSLLPAITKTPSVCNRQHWRLHVFSGDKKNELLSLQNGNAGFKENIPYLAIITSDLRAFYNATERNQAYTDGGMFAMSLIYALESVGISSCALNWCVTPQKDTAMYNLNIIPKNETVIMFIAFGYPFEEGFFANSPRLDINKFFTLHEK
jgi:nitroreductase